VFIGSGLMIFGGARSIGRAAGILVPVTADASMGFMAIINLFAILLLAKYSVAAWHDYRHQLESSAEPVFSSHCISGLEQKLVDNCWKH